MKFTSAVSLLFILSLVIGVAGCGKMETPPPVVAEKDKPALTVAPPVAPPADPNRHAAEWVLRIGGTIDVVTDGKRRGVKVATDLPQNNFTIVVINTTGKPVSDSDLEQLQSLNDLEILWSGGASITDAGLVHLGNLSNLRELSVAGSGVSGSGLQHLKSLAKLRRLGLDGSAVTDAGLEHLRGMELDLLNLDGTKVTDQGLQAIRGLPKLKELQLHGTKVTDAGVAELETALPGLKVKR